VTGISLDWSTHERRRLGRDGPRVPGLHRSVDRGATWTAADWEFGEDAGIFAPAFVQFGRGHGDAPDRYVLAYAPRAEPAGGTSAGPARSS